MALPLLATFFSGTFIAGFLSKLMFTLGLGVFFFTSVDQLSHLVQDQIEKHFSALPLAIIQILHMSGLTTVMNWAITTYFYGYALKAAKPFLLSSKASVK